MRNNMNILFFDFDGVLAGWQDWYEYEEKDAFEPTDVISNNRIRFINKILKDENLEAVFFPISSWSNVFKDKNVLNDWLKKMNLTNLKPFNGIGEHYYCLSRRGDFIRKILQENDVKNYIIFDDEEWQNEYKGLNIIKTSMYDGIMHEHAKMFCDYIEQWE